MNTGYWLPQGSILHEKYSIKKGLGQGGFAITYLAYDTMLQQNVAIKEYFPVRYAKRLSSHLSNVGNENSLTEEMVSFQLSATSMVYPQPGQEENYLKGMQNFLGEARLLFGKFDIEGIVFIKDFFEENGTAYIVMEYVTGMTLREYEKKKGKISEAEAYKLLLPIVKAISYLHSMGIIHCDISPDNLIFCQKNHLKLIDFGAAKLKGYQKGQKKEIQKETYYKGSYTPPEQYYDVKEIGPWTDIYALCAVWYELLTGNKVPLAIERMQRDKLKPVSTVIAVSPQMEEILQRGLSVEIPKRYFCAVNLYYDIKKTEQFVNKTDKFIRQTDKINVEIQKKEAQKTESKLKKYMKAIRQNWGGLWLWITTEVNEKNITQKGKWISKRRIKRGMQIIIAIMMLALFTGIGREIYIYKYPEQYFAYKVKKNTEYYLLHPRKNEYTNKQMGYEKLVENINKLAYKRKEDKEYAYCTYELSEKDLKKLNLISNEYETLPLSETDMEKAIVIFMQIKRNDIESISTDYDNEIIQRKYGKIREIKVDAKEKKEITYANQERIRIIYDPVDQCTYEISFTGKFKRIKKFIECMQPLLCPDNYLTDVDYNYIFSEIKKKKTTSSYDIGPDYALELTRDDNEDNPYTEYTTSIKMKFFLNPFY